MGLTGHDQLDLLRHGRAQPVGGVASVSPLELVQLLVGEGEGSSCCWVCADVWGDEVLAVFGPSVPVGSASTNQIMFPPKDRQTDIVMTQPQPLM